MDPNQAPIDAPGFLLLPAFEGYALQNADLACDLVACNRFDGNLSTDQKVDQLVQVDDVDG